MPGEGPIRSWREAFAVYLHPRVIVMLFLGFSAGLPFLLIFSTLSFWLREADVSRTVIGFFSWVGITFSIKVLWAPVVDRTALPLLTRAFGRRRGWMLITQLCLLSGIAAMAKTSPPEATWLMASLAFFVAFTSASQDIVFDAYRTDVLRPRERGFGAAVSVGGYRVAMLVSGALALILADQIGWVDTYMLMAMLMGVGMVATMLGPEPKAEAKAPHTLAEAVWGPLKEFFSRHGALAMLVLIVLYKLGDAFAGTLTTAFLIRGPGFTPTDVGVVNKGMGLAATLFGAFIGGVLLAMRHPPLALATALVLFVGLLYRAVTAPRLEIA